MPRNKTGPKRNVWTDPSPYGTYEGPRGNPDEWKETWKSAIGGLPIEDVKLQDSPYAILDVHPNASWDDIQKSFRRLILIHHPDKGGDKEKCIQIISAFKQLQEING